MPPQGFNQQNSDCFEGNTFCTVGKLHDKVPSFFNKTARDKKNWKRNNII